MAGLPNSIGPFAFLRLEGFPIVPRRALAVLQRAGVDGSGVLRLGVKGRPMQLTSYVDAYNGAGAALALAQYQQLIGADPVAVVYSGIDLTNFGARYAVLEVEPLELRALAGAVGGLFPPSFAWVAAQWQLLPVSV